MNPWKVLGVSCNASLEECKKAYRKLCIKNHPDNGGDVKAFDDINKAWQMIQNGVSAQVFSVKRKVLHHKGLFSYEVR